MDLGLRGIEGRGDRGELTSDRASNVTGAVFVIDGGLVKTLCGE